MNCPKEFPDYNQIEPIYIIKKKKKKKTYSPEMVHIRLIVYCIKYLNSVPKMQVVLLH